MALLLGTLPCLLSGALYFWPEAFRPPLAAVFVPAGPAAGALPGVVHKTMGCARAFPALLHPSPPASEGRRFWGSGH